ncbi:MAG: hypothetical protein RLZZ616_1960, partial [Pseudomonadota bacterium]
RCKRNNRFKERPQEEAVARSAVIQVIGEGVCLLLVGWVGWPAPAPAGDGTMEPGGAVTSFR